MAGADKQSLDAIFKEVPRIAEARYSSNRLDVTA